VHYIAITIDVSQKSNWENGLVPHLDELPFHLIGMGEQSTIKILLALENKKEESQVILIEEPENHLSFSTMNILLSRIQEKCKGKQIIVATHSAYVLNKLGIEKVILLHGNKPVPLKQLSAGTQTYFKKLPGYDTLRLILAAKAVLVEGPSDELILQKAYLLKHGRLPIEDGVDVISVRGLSFARFLEIASALEKEVAVVIDNDGNYDEKVKSRYSEYREKQNIRICADTDNSAKSLEPQLAKCNELQTLNEIFGTKHDDLAALISYMENNKTECALKIFDTQITVKMPDYIKDAVQ
jgi:predicted ATP-dependent endonuclease of OLD family